MSKAFESSGNPLADRLTMVGAKVDAARLAVLGLTIADNVSMPFATAIADGILLLVSEELEDITNSMTRTPRAPRGTKSRPQATQIEANPSEALIQPLFGTTQEAAE